MMDVSPEVSPVAQLGQQTDWLIRRCRQLRPWLQHDRPDVVASCVQSLADIDPSHMRAAHVMHACQTLGTTLHELGCPRLLWSARQGAGAGPWIGCAPQLGWFLLHARQADGHWLIETPVGAGRHPQLSQLQLVDETGFDSASLHDFITNVATTQLDITFTGALAPGDRVLVQTGQNQTPIDITAELPDVFVLGGTHTVDNVTLESGSNALSVWVEDDVGNKGQVFIQPYVYVATMPGLDLDGANGATSLTSVVSTVAAQRGVVLGNQIAVTDLLPSVGIAEILVIFGVDGNSNGNSERLWVKSGLDINLNAASATLRGLQFADIDGYVTLQPGGGSELHFSKTSDVSGHTTAYFSASEVQSLLGGLRYFNTANVDAIETGERTFAVQLTDRATQVSETQTATIRLAAPSLGDTSGADVNNNSIIGTVGDDILLGLRGNDILTGSGGNDTFMWVSGDAFSAVGVAGSVGSPVTDRITDFSAWNAATPMGDQLDIAKLLVGYTSTSSLSQWVKAVENGVTYQDGMQGARLTIDVNGSSSGGAIQIIELQGVTLGSPAANTPALLLSELVSTQQLKVL